MTEHLHHLQAVAVTVAAVTVLPTGAAIALVMNGVSDSEGGCASVIVLGLVILVGFGCICGEIGIRTWVWLS